MTPAEVLAASDGKATERMETSGGKQVKRMVSNHVAGPFSFDVGFSFNSRTQRLQRVLLQLRDIEKEGANCGALEGALFQRYGVPTSETKDQFFKLLVWHLREANTAVGLTRVLPKGSCPLDYSALLNDDNDSL
jgi:hypothetical protein